MKKNLDPKKISSNATTNEIIEAYNDLADKFTFLSTKMSLNNFDGQILEIEIKAGEEKRISHSLGVKPNYRVILSQSGNGVISDDPLKSNQHSIVLKNHGTLSSKIKVLLIKE